MNSPPKKLSFADEMTLLKQQKEEAAKLLRLDASEARAQRQAVVLAKVSPNVSNEQLDALQSAALVDFLTAKPAEQTTLVLLPGRTQTTDEQAYAAREKAMSAALAFYVDGHQDKKRKRIKSKPHNSMAFCTNCRCTTPGEHVKPDNTGIGFALGIMGSVPGVAYFLYRQTGGKKQCTHCEATTLVAMNSVQARTLCGDQHAALMADGWLEMRSAEREHIQARRYAIGMILVVAVVILGASLYMLRLS